MKIIQLCILFLGLSLNSFAQAPTINPFPSGSATVAPFSGATGTTMTITGTNFTTAITAVSFGGIPASTFTVVSSTRIDAVVAGGASGLVSLTTPGGTISQSGFTYLPLSRIVTDFGGYWSTTTASASTTIPDNAHNLLGFGYNNNFYSTGVNDGILSANGVSFTAGNYRSLPVAGISGSNPLSSSSVFLAMASKVDGNASMGVVAGVASQTIKSVLTDGIRGLGLGTGVTNLPASAILTFNIFSINNSKIADAEPDILITQIADPSVGNDVFQFTDAAGSIVGNTVTQDMTELTSFGTYNLDLFNLTAGAPYNTATPATVSSNNATRSIRVVAFKLSDFGITVANAANVKALKITPSGNSDYAFIAYNANAINLPPDISTNDAATTSSVCATGTATLSVIGTAATGGSLSYTWEGSTNGGSTWSTVSNGGNFSGATTSSLSISNPVNGYMYRATVTESTSGYTNTSLPFTLTVSPVTVGGTTVGSTTICSGSNATLTLSGYTGSVVRWESSTNSFSSVTSIANTTASLTAVNVTATTQYRAVIQSGTCSSATSSVSTVTVNAPSVGGSVGGSASSCPGTNSTILTLTGNTGSVVKWQSSTDNFISVITDIANTTNTLTATNLTATKQYRAVVQSGVCASATSSIAAVTIYTGQWIGGASGDWNNSANWCGGIPTSASNVVIPAYSTLYIQSNNAAFNTLTISPNATLIMSGNYNLTIAAGGSFTNNGTFDASASTGVVSFAGNGTISGTTVFQNIETYGALDFGTSSTIAGEFTLQTGASVTANSPIYLCPGSTLTYNTTGVYARNLEWPSVSSGKGLPSNVHVKNNTTINFPAAGTGYICNDLTIDNGSALYQSYSGGSAALTVGRNVTINGILSLGNNSGDDITAGGNWTRNAGGIFNNNSRRVTFNSSNNSVITAPASAARDANGAFGGETFYNITVNKTAAANMVSLASNISVTNELKLTAGIFDLVNSDVTVVSNASSTAHIGSIPASGATVRYGGTGGTGTGRFIIQRHLLIGSGSSSRRWRLLTAPIQAAGAPSVNTAWQEGVSNADRNNPVDPSPGFGTAITKSTVYNPSDGFDQGSTINPSIYVHTSPSTWTTLTSTNAGAITDNEGYMLFVRGNRSIVVSTSAINASPTILEPKGRINTGDVQKTLTTGLQVIGNPYASEINFGTASFNNFTVSGSTYNNTTPASAGGVGITYYIFDPKTSGTSGVGKFISCSSNGDGTFAVTGNSSGLPVNGLIESGSAIAIVADNSGGTITFHETDKTTSSSTTGISSRTGSSNQIATLTTNLFAGSGIGAQIADGVINAYNTKYLNEVNSQDALKLNSFNSKEGISIVRDNTSLAIERRNNITANDTIFLNMANMNKIGYQLQFIGKNIDPSFTAILEDKFAGVSKPINIADTTYYPFNITDDVNSGAADRFHVIFKPNLVLPITIKSVKAFKQNNNIAVQWVVENEMNTKEYEVEKSTDGTGFTKVNVTPATGNNASTVTYNWIDKSSAAGTLFYRIKSIHSDGSFEYSIIVKVEFENAAEGITVYPNPVTDGNIGLVLNNIPAGSYQFKIINASGQIISKKSINYAGGNASKIIISSSKLPGGLYHAELSGAQKTYSLQLVVIPK